MKLNRGLPVIIYDYETTGIDPNKCQLTQIAAMVIDSRTLNVKQGGLFNTEVCPIFDDERAISLGYAPVEAKALEVTRKTKEGLMGAPEEKVAWANFRSFCKRFNPSGDSYKAPIPAGYNINGYDSIITKRMCDKYGPVDKNGRPSLFNPIFKLDVMDMMFSWLEFDDDLTGLSLTKLCEFLGFPSEMTDNAHDGMVDVRNTANILIKFLKFQRDIASKTNFKEAFSNGVFYV
jgi:DNA polymerase III epsilon subunit-like protein